MHKLVRASGQVSNCPSGWLCSVDPHHRSLVTELTEIDTYDEGIEFNVSYRRDTIMTPSRTDVWRSDVLHILNVMMFYENEMNITHTVSNLRLLLYRQTFYMIHLVKTIG